MPRRLANDPPVTIELRMYRTPAMNKTLLSLLMLFSLALAALPGSSRAAGGDYIPLHVPDLHQAVAFFHDVMNCAVVDGEATRTPAESLMDCGHGSMLELSADTPPRAVTTKRGEQASVAVTFVTDDAVSAAQWLRANHVALIGQPVRIAHGTDADTTAVTFLTPWGDRLQLVSHATADPLHAAATRLALQ